MRQSRAKTPREPIVKILETDFADMQAGQSMAIGTPELIEELVWDVPKGKFLSLSELRQTLARRLKAEGACPVTTSMFLRRAIEAAFPGAEEGQKTFPFWRVVDPKSPLFKRLDASIQAFILTRREAEAAGLSRKQ